MRKFLISLLLLLVAIELELVLGTMGIFISLAFGMLIACACELSLQAFVILELIAVMMFRTASLADPNLLILVIFPIVIGFFYRSTHWESWIFVPAAATLGAFLMALVSGVSLGAIGIFPIIEDMAATGIVALCGHWIVTRA